MTLSRTFLAFGAFSGFLGVALGALGAHALRGWLESFVDGPWRLSLWHTATEYHLVHAVALGLAALTLERTAGGAATLACWAFGLGTVLFSGSLYTMTLTGLHGLGALTPLGGLALLCGWACLGIAALRG
jgi:uncharacterized membrane protein YgdD (TMEM256/DUF423 family)